MSEETGRDGATPRMACAPSAAGRVPAAAGFAQGARLVRLEGFEEPFNMEASERDEYRRRFATLFVDESTACRGGLGTVARATNAMGETCALKTLIMPERSEMEDDAAYADRCDLACAAFRAEYESQRSLSGFKGFPKLFGYARNGGSPAIVMEWVEGVTLAEAARTLAVDGDGRLAPLVAARIGRDLLGLLTRLELVGEGFVHRDISPSNILVRTAHLSVAEQADEGSFDLCLIDFGSSVSLDPVTAPGYTARYAMMRCATADYAPPEMLTADLPDLAELRKSEKIDVYAAASVIFELAGGGAPYDLSRRPDASPYRIKADGGPRPLIMAHETADELRDVLAFEPEALAVAEDALLDLREESDAAAFRSALVRVDAQLADALRMALEPLQADRPAAGSLRNRLASFCARYGENVARVLRGEPLIPCTDEGPSRGAITPRAVNGFVGAAGLVLSAAALLTVIGLTGLLLDGATARLDLGPFAAEARLTMGWVACLLALPAAAGMACRSLGRDPRGRFAFGTLALGLTAAVLLAAAANVEFAGESGRLPLLAAVLLAASAGWCPLVLEYATLSAPDADGAARAKLPGTVRHAVGDSEAAGDAAAKSIQGEVSDATDAL